MKSITPIFKIAESESECVESLRLVAEVFSSSSSLFDYEEYKQRLWSEDPSFDRNNLILTVGSDGEIIGVIRIVPSILYRVNKPIAVAGISSVCLKENYRGLGLSTPMMSFALGECRRRGYEIAALFSRRVLDHYYCRFGFSGVASYSRIRFCCPESVRATARPGLDIVECHTAQFEILNDLYQRCYGLTFGYVERSLAYWRFMKRRIEYIGDPVMKAVILDGVIAGYFMLSGDVVCELAADVDRVDLVDLICCIEGVVEKDISELEFSISPQHVMMASSRWEIDKTISQRSCSYGGHMVNLLNVEKVFSLWLDRINNICRRVAIRSFSGRFGMVEYSWNGRKFSAAVDQGASALDYQTTCLLLGCETAHGLPVETPFMLDREPFNTPLADHF